MSTDKNLLRRIYQKTDGYCHICHRKLSFQNYGRRNAKGVWQIEHSIARAKGGTDHFNNLFPACVKCNLEKGTMASRSARSNYGNTRAPHSKERKKRIKENNITAGAIIGGLIGLAAGPWGAAVGATVGGFIGNENSPRI